MDGIEQRELSQTDILTALEINQMIAQAQARAVALQEALEVYAAHLRTKYECDGAGWELTDWAQGFVRRVQAEAEEVEGGD